MTIVKFGFYELCPSCNTISGYKGMGHRKSKMSCAKCGSTWESDNNKVECNRKDCTFFVNNFFFQELRFYGGCYNHKISVNNKGFCASYFLDPNKPEKIPTRPIFPPLFQALISCFAECGYRDDSKCSLNHIVITGKGECMCNSKRGRWPIGVGYRIKTSAAIGSWIKDLE